MSKVLRYAGLAQEATYAEDPAPAAAFHVDIASSSLDTPSDTQLVYEGGLGRSPRTHRPGYYSPSGNLVYAFDIRTIGFLLKWALGGYVHTDDSAGSGFQIHEAYGVDDTLLDSFCARIGKDVFEHVFSGCTIGQLTIAVEGEYAQATAEIQAAKDAEAALQAKADLLLPDEYPLAFHELTASIAGGDESASIKTMQLQISNNVQTDSGRGMGSRHPVRMPVGEREVTLDLGLWYEDTDHLQRVWGGAGGPQDAGSTEFPATLTLDAATDGQLVVDLPRLVDTQVQQQPSGRSEITQQVASRAFADTITLDDGVTDVDAELLATLSNNEPDMT